METLSTFKNTNYTNYVELLSFYSIPLSMKEKKESIETQNKIIDYRNYILFDLVTLVIELIEQKAEKILENNLKYSRYNSRYLFQNCLLICELFIKSERDLAKYAQIRNRHNDCIEKCKSEIKK